MRWLGKMSAADFLTLLNALAGFLAITYILDGLFVTASLFIILALVFDGIDGPVARRYGSTHHFGRFLDSMSDAVSFCFAPALLVYANFYDPDLGSAWVNMPNAAAVIGSLFIGAFGILRLARFSAVDFRRPYFVGLPTPAIALGTVTVTALLGDPEMNPLSHGFHNYPAVGILTILAFLMVSEIKFPKIRGDFVVLTAAAGIMVVLPLLLLQFWPGDICVRCLRNIETMALVPLLAYLLAGPFYVWWKK